MTRPSKLTYSCLAMAAAGGIAVATGPRYAALCAVTVLCLIVSIAAPKVFAATTVVVVLLSESAAQATGLQLFNLSDELGVLICVIMFSVRRILNGNRLRGLVGWPWFSLYLAVGLISSILHTVHPIWVVQDAYLFLKGPAFTYAVSQLDWTTKDLRRIARAGVAATIVFLAACGINGIIPSAWTATFALTGSPDYRYGFPSLIGPFVHPFVAAQFSALAFVAVLAYRSIVTKSRLSALLLILTGGANFLTFRRKSLVALIGSSLSSLALLPRRRALAVFMMVLVLPILGILGWSVLRTASQMAYAEYLANPTGTSRTVFYHDSAVIALQHFPFGVGLSRYGSYLAGVHYSPEYVQRNYSSIYGLGTGSNNLFLTDTFWPAVLGESGVLGVLGYSMGLWEIARVGLGGRHSHDPLVRWASVALAAWSLEYLIESSAAPTYSGPPLFLLLFGLAGVVSVILVSPNPYEREGTGC